MMSSSKYFEALLGPNFREGNSTDDIVLNDIDGETLKQIVQFCSIGKIDLNCDNVNHILWAASSMNLIELENKCCHFLKENLTINNLTDTLMMAELFCHTSLKQNIINYFGIEFNNIPKKTLMFLNREQFIDLMRCEKIMASEEIIFERIQEYIERNCEGFMEVETALLSCVKLECLSELVSLRGVY